MRISMPIRRHSGSGQPLEALKTFATSGLRWSGHTALAVLLTLSLLTTSGCGGSDDGGETVAQSDTKAGGGGGGGGGMPGGGALAANSSITS